MAFNSWLIAYLIGRETGQSIMGAGHSAMGSGLLTGALQ